MNLYRLQPDADGIVLVFNFAGQQVIKLEGGFADVVVMTYQNMNHLGGHRGDDYMAGVIAGVMHCHLLRPDCFSPLPNIESAKCDKPMAVFNRPECPFHYCDQEAPYEACQDRCRHRPGATDHE